MKLSPRRAEKFSPEQVSHIQETLVLYQLWLDSLRETTPILPEWSFITDFVPLTIRKPWYLSIDQVAKVIAVVFLPGVQSEGEDLRAKVFVQLMKTLIALHEHEAEEGSVWSDPVILG